MKIDIQARDFELTDALKMHIGRRMDFALSARYDHIQKLQVRLSDVNGTRGGADKCCQVVIALPRHQDVVAQDTEVDMYAAINRAIDRAARSVARRLSRRRSRTMRTIAAEPINELTNAAIETEYEQDLMRA